MDDDDNTRLGMWIGIGAGLFVTLGTVLALLWSTADEDGVAGATAAAKAGAATMAAAGAPTSAAVATAAKAAAASVASAAPAAQVAATAAAAAAAVAAPAATTTAAATTDADITVDLPLTGELLGKVYFEVGKSDFSADGTSTIDKAVAAVGEGARKVVLSGFHDLSGNAVQNAELAKNRAKAVRETLKIKGVAADRIVLRKPAETGAGGPPEEARRVEIRLVD